MFVYNLLNLKRTRFEGGVGGAGVSARRVDERRAPRLAAAAAAARRQSEAKWNEAIATAASGASAATVVCDCLRPPLQGW